jgi:hypothetical protein
MSFKNSSTYVQRQTNLMLLKMHAFARVFIDDIVIFFKTFENHLRYLDIVFQRLSDYDVFMSLKKRFLSYFFIILLDQIVDVLSRITSKKKLKIVSFLIFSHTLSELEKYLDIIE